MVALNTQKQNAWTNEIFVGGGREFKTIQNMPKRFSVSTTD